MGERCYSRKYLRIKTDWFMHAELSIVQVGVRKVNSHAARVRVMDISPGGLKFITPLNLPFDKSVHLEMNFKVMEQPFRLKGNIVYKNHMEVNENEYGFCFSETDDALKFYIRKLFNNMTVKMRRHVVILKLI